MRAPLHGPLLTIWAYFLRDFVPPSLSRLSNRSEIAPYGSHEGPGCYLFYYSISPFCIVCTRQLTKFNKVLASSAKVSQQRGRLLIGRGQRVLASRRLEALAAVGTRKSPQRGFWSKIAAGLGVCAKGVFCWSVLTTLSLLLRDFRNSLSQSGSLDQMKKLGALHCRVHVKTPPTLRKFHKDCAREGGKVGRSIFFCFF